MSTIHLNQIANFFPQVVRAKARSYVDDGSIQEYRCDAKGIQARVLGRRLYETSFTAVDEESWEPFCTCPAFAPDEPCKHLWALLKYTDEERGRSLATTILIEQQNVYDKIYHGMQLSFESGDLDDDEDDDEDDEEIEHEDASWTEFLQDLQKVEGQAAEKHAISFEKLALVYNESKSNRSRLALFEPYVLAKGAKTYKHRKLHHLDVEKFLLKEDRDLARYIIDQAQAAPKALQYGLLQTVTEFALPNDFADGLLSHLSDRQSLFLNARDLRDWRPLRFVPGVEVLPRFIVKWQDEAFLELSMRYEGKGWSRAWNAPDVVLLNKAYVLFESEIYHMALSELADQWRLQIRSGLEIPAKKARPFLDQVQALIPEDRLEIPYIEDIPAIRVPMTPVIRFMQNDLREEVPAFGELIFLYGMEEVRPNNRAPFIRDTQSEQRILRDTEAEARIVELLPTLLKEGEAVQGGILIWPQRFLETSSILIEAGLGVQLNRKPLTPYKPVIMISSGIDWLNVSVNDGEEPFDWRAFLKKIVGSRQIVTLADGSLRYVDPKTRRTLERLSRLVEKEKGEDAIRTSRLPLLDQLLRDDPLQPVPSAVRRYRNFVEGLGEGVEPVYHKDFHGTLRPYQEKGRRWLLEMLGAGFGVCLADEMGLGKTIQVLSLLASLPKGKGQHLIIVPRSLIGNWLNEFRRFVPSLKVLDHSQAKRTKSGFDGYDVVLTTYGIVLRDRMDFGAQTWRTIVLDEAQAIKNYQSQTSEAVRSLPAKNRLALSGTPIENSTYELASLFDFLNPGLLGAESFKILQGGDKEDSGLIVRSLRPLVLRRKKDEVAKDLPEKTVNLLYCTFDPPQQKLYENYAKAYRARLMERVEDGGFGSSKLLMIEAMLRLRQVSCDPRLLDPESKVSSAKVEILMEKLSEIAESDDKVLIFSQFTSFLKLIENRLKKEGMVYEYLDGSTTNRDQRIARFQTNPDVKYFLISLKAGGVGLNLTAARYAFIMDPWWNPAVEEQAIGRVHRIGQTRNVVVFKVVAKDTIEEKILSLQEQKQDLVSSFLDAEDETFLQRLTFEDLKVLMS